MYLKYRITPHCFSKSPLQQEAHEPIEFVRY
jgi:hypothetical protein